MSSSGLQKWALVGALFAATHTHANETRQVVSSNGTTNIVERIDFPVGEIKDIVPAGDKYIIHANPIDSLKDNVAQDALFVMEKDNPNAAFGRTFSKEINSVAYVPGLDIAVWSYKSGRNTELLELKNDESALRAAAANNKYEAAGMVNRIYPNTILYSSPSNNVHEVGLSERAHDFYFQDGKYVESQTRGTFYLDEDRKLSARNEQGVFVLSPESGKLFRYGFNLLGYSDELVTINPATSIAAVPNGENTDDGGNVIIGNSNGEAVSYPYTADSVGQSNASTQIFNTPVNDMALTSDNTIKAISTNDNSVAEVNANLNLLDCIIPSNQETGYRRVVVDQDSTLLLSNTHSNCFYRIRKSR